ncbi:MAG TPA: hypothetical protein VD931_23185 [Baekduia sp.]|nr:hypothetical protein [Baekduia sp.]
MRRLNPSVVISCLALFVALGGTAVAAKTLITSSSQVKNGSITGTDIANGSIRGGDIANGTITASKLAAGARPRAASAAGMVAHEVVRKTGPALTSSGGATVATMRSLAPGQYLILAKTTMSPDKEEQGLGELLRDDKSGFGHCVLNAGGDVDDARESLTQPGAQQPSTLNMQLTRTIGEPTDVTLVCESNQPFHVTDSSIVALKLGGTTRADVTE